MLAIVYGCKPSSRKDVVDLSSPQELGVTIGSLCETVGYEDVKVFGHGLVWGLAGTGSRDCPTGVRSYLEQYLSKIELERYLGPEYEGMTVKEIINSPTTAVVRVNGTVLAGAPKGTVFDVQVNIPWSSQTASLEGGWLLPTELQIVVPGRSITSPMARHESAMAMGQIFINPFPRKSVGTRRLSQRRGTVLGGGRTFSDRLIYLGLLEPNTLRAQIIQRRINGRFQLADGYRVADATRRKITISIPENYRHEHQHFISVLLSLFLQDSAAFQELKLKEMDEMVRKSGADYETISLTWEGIGLLSLPYLGPLYENGSGEIAYYAARTALRLGDDGAVVSLIEMASDHHSPVRLLATKELSRIADEPRARKALIKLLDSNDMAIRLLAYQGLRRKGDSRVRSVSLPGGFSLDIVVTSGENVICVWGLREPRMVLFGQNISCGENVFFESKKEALTINANKEDEHLTIHRQTGRRGDYESIKCSRGVDKLIVALTRPIKGSKYGEKRFTFSQIARILHDLCREKVIPAKYVVQLKENDFMNQTRKESASSRQPGREGISAK